MLSETSCGRENALPYRPPLTIYIAIMLLISPGLALPADHTRLSGCSLICLVCVRQLERPFTIMDDKQVSLAFPPTLQTVEEGSKAAFHPYHHACHVRLPEVNLLNYFPNISHHSRRHYTRVRGPNKVKTSIINNIDTLDT